MASTSLADMLDLSGTGARCLGRLTVNRPAKTLTDEDIRRAILSPDPQCAAGAATVLDTIRPGESVCIVVSDQTRKTAADRILPALMEGLTARGCRLTDAFILFASGIHRHPLPSEVTHILGAEAAREFEGRIIFHDPDDRSNLVAAGKTSRGHTVEINRLAVETDRLILLGSVVYHYHAGFGGGRKSLVPGLASRETIAWNHSLTLDPAADRIHPRVAPGILDGNPVAEEMLEGALMCEPDLVVNTVLTPDGAPAGVFGGDMVSAHTAACRLAERIYRQDLAEPADFVIASAGGASTWIQAHKALFNADRAVKCDGRIVLVAPCAEGLGDERFRYWIRKPDIRDIFAEIRKSPEVLGQTALSTRRRAPKTTLVTKMPPADAADLGVRTAPDLRSAVDEALAGFRSAGNTAPTFYVMDEAMYTVPFLKRPGTEDPRGSNQ